VSVDGFPDTHGSERGLTFRGVINAVVDSTHEIGNVAELMARRATPSDEPSSDATASHEWWPDSEPDRLDAAAIRLLKITGKFAETCNRRPELGARNLTMGAFVTNAGRLGLQAIALAAMAECVSGPSDTEHTLRAVRQSADDLVNQTALIRWNAAQLRERQCGIPWVGVGGLNA